ncbi:HD domain-containing protein [Oceanidesulfovibrio marinus]|uniref:Bifunctional uridylyltransferase/uridylyl-removing enzyme n=1 Tax=Oceanidesulfovibrio marinus TaxID=370038 RepID=A0ABX6NGX4_9BACT|nr:HD domain-containing protein [Oceanidesulfovibrio marinus]QJT09859.1 HD domain-containing protein [Oceanidesulfovibrio marinus]
MTMDASHALEAVRREAADEPGQAGTPWLAAARAMDLYLALRLGEAVSEPSAKAQRSVSGGDDSTEKSNFLDVEGPPAHVAVVALGGYGRKELCPHSDVDILLLVDDELYREAEEVERIAGYILLPLWDAGFDVGHGVRTVRQCVDLAQEDLPAAMAHMDARFIAGGRALFDRLKKELGADMARRRGGLAAALREAAAIRADEYGDVAALLEPELKHGRGGLRDLQTMVWLDSLHAWANGDSVGAAVAGTVAVSLFSDADLAELDEARKALLRARCAVQRRTRGKRNRIILEEAPDYARSCGIETEDQAVAGEEFIHMVHAAAYVVRAGWAQFWRAWDGDPLPALPSCDSAWDMLSEVVRSGVPLGLAGRRAVRRALAAMQPKNAQLWDAAERIPRMLLEKHGLLFAQECLETGFLTAVYPEFGCMQNLVQYDGFHVHTQGRHALETVRTMRDLLRVEADDEPPVEGASGRWLAELSARALEMCSAEELVSASLFHDVGKPQADHEAAGEHIVARVLTRQGAPYGEIERVGFLVANHLLLSLTALKEDLSEESVIAKVAGIVESRERLAALTLLTIADARATGPTAWNAWLARLLCELVEKVDHMLAVGPLAAPHAAQALMNARDRVRRQARGRFEAAEVERWLDKLPPRYLLTRDASEIVTHMEEIGRLIADQEEDIRRKPSGRGGLGVNRILTRAMGAGLYEVTLFARDAPGLFATFTGAMALQQLSLHAADVFTLGDGTAVDIFTVGGLPDALYPEEVFKRLSMHIREASAGRLDLAYRIAERRASPLAPAEPSHIACSARPRRDLSAVYTVIEATAPARYGVVYDMACALRDAGLDVCQAKIALRGPELTVTFQVREQAGGLLGDDRAEAAAAAVCEASGDGEEDEESAAKSGGTS